MIRFFRSFPRHLKSALLSIVRQLAMSLSSASAVMVTLMLFAGFLLIAGNIDQFTRNIEDDFRIHVILKEEVVDDVDIQNVQDQLAALDNVHKVTFSPKEEELEMFIFERGKEFEIYRGENNPLHHAFFVSVKNADFIETVTQNILKVDGIKDAVYGGDSVSKMIDILNTIRSGGGIFLILLSLLALFLISNTIKMTIHARRREISIMRNVGATNIFIKTPFMIEGMIIGIMGSIIPCLLTFFGYRYLFNITGGKLVTNLLSLRPAVPFAIQVCLILLGSGMIVGLLGSFYAVTKYLKWKR